MRNQEFLMVVFFDCDMSGEPIHDFFYSINIQQNLRKSNHSSLNKPVTHILSLHYFTFGGKNNTAITIKILFYYNQFKHLLQQFKWRSRP